MQFLSSDIIFGYKSAKIKKFTVLNQIHNGKSNKVETYF